jgi:hypothetical protein
MRLKVEVKNEILGDSIFWEGDEAQISKIRNICARRLAELVSKDGRSRNAGMWFVSAVVHEQVVGNSADAGEGS